MNPEKFDNVNKPSHYQGSRRWNMRIKTSNDSIINVDSVKDSITIEGVEFGSDCRALVSKHRDGTGTITLVFEGKII